MGSKHKYREEKRWEGLRTVNNKYLINYEINIEENFREYVVRKYDDNKRYILCILKNDFTYEKTRQYLLSKFKTIKNLNFENVVNLLDIEIINNVDGYDIEQNRAVAIAWFFTKDNGERYAH